MERMNLIYIVMRKNVFSLALLFSASLMAACNQMGSYVQTIVSKTVADANNEVNAYDYKDSKEHGAVVERNVQVAPFTELTIDGRVRVVYTQGEETKVTIRGNEKDLERYEVRSRDGELYIHTKSSLAKINSSSPRLTAYVTAPMVNEIDVSGACLLEMPQKVEQNSALEIDGSGAVKVNIANMEVHALTLDISGAGDVKLKQVKAKDHVDIGVSGAGEVAGSVAANVVNVGLSGAGDVSLTVNCDNLVSNVSGAGDLTLKGKCRTFRKSKSGAASLHTHHLKVTGK